MGTEVNQLLLYHDLIAGIVAAMEARDAYTANHSMSILVLNLRKIQCALLRLLAFLVLWLVPQKKQPLFS